MDILKHKLNLRHRPAPEKISKCGHLVASLRKLPQAKQDSIKLEVFQTAHKNAAAAEAALNELRAQVKAALATRDAAVKVMEKAAHLTALDYVVHAREQAELEAVGIAVQAPRHSIGLPKAPTRLRSAKARGESGGVKLRWQRPVRHCFHIVEMTSDPNHQSGWTRVTQCGRASCEVRGLEIGRKYWFRVCASTASGEGPWAMLPVHVGA